MNNNDWLVIAGLGIVAYIVMTKRNAATTPQTAGLSTPYGLPYSSYYANTVNAQNPVQSILNTIGGAQTPVGHFGTPVGGGRVPYSQLGTAPQNAAFTGAGSPAFTGTGALTA